MGLDEIFWNSNPQPISEEESKANYGKATAFVDIDLDSNDEVVQALRELEVFKTVAGTLRYYKDGYYAEDAEQFLRTELENHIPEISRNRKVEIITKLKDRTQTDIKEFDKDPEWIPLKNGWVNYKTREFKAHSP